MQKEIMYTQLKEMVEIIQEQVEIILEEQHPPQIEFDILLKNVREFYEKIRMLQRLEEIPVPFGAPPSKAASPSPSVNLAPPPAVSPLPPAAPPPEVTGTLSHTPKPTEKAAGEKEETPGDLNLFAVEEPGFSIKLKEAREKSLPKKSGATHVKSLISINDKFIFINELFDGNLKEYNETIEKLNTLHSKNDALDLLDLLRKQNLWELGSGTFLKLKEIVEGYYP